MAFKKEARATLPPPENEIQEDILGIEGIPTVMYHCASPEDERVILTLRRKIWADTSEQERAAPGFRCSRYPRLQRRPQIGLFARAGESEK
jgi:hypothetical protein